MLNIGDKVIVDIPPAERPGWYGVFEIIERHRETGPWVIDRIVNEISYTDHKAYLLKGSNYLFDGKWLKQYVKKP